MKILTYNFVTTFSGEDVWISLLHEKQFKQAIRL